MHGKVGLHLIYSRNNKHLKASTIAKKSYFDAVFQRLATGIWSTGVAERKNFRCSRAAKRLSSVLVPLSVLPSLLDLPLFPTITADQNPVQRLDKECVGFSPKLEINVGGV